MRSTTKDLLSKQKATKSNKKQKKAEIMKPERLNKLIIASQQDPSFHHPINNQVVPSSWMKEHPLLFTKEGERVLPGRAVLMYDIDAPYPEHPSKSPILHWLHLWNQKDEEDEVPYHGPSPPVDSRPHRYIVEILEGDPHRDYASAYASDYASYGSLKRYRNERTKFPLNILRDQFGLRPVARGFYLSQT
jgi:hypothetical protein